jgi:hypothetical protein
MFAMGAANNYRGVQRVSRMSYVFCKASQKREKPLRKRYSSTTTAAARPRHGLHTHIYLQPPEDKDTKAAPDWASETPANSARPELRSFANSQYQLGRARPPPPPPLHSRRQCTLHFASNQTALNISRIAQLLPCS